MPINIRNLFLFQDNKKPGFWIIAFNLIIIFVLLLFILLISLKNLDYQFNWNSIIHYKYLFFQGWLNTVLISISALGLSLIIGFISALCQKSRIIPIYYLFRYYIELIRSTPLLVQILIFFYVIAASISLNNRYLIGVLTLSFFSGAYVSEIIRGGLESISESQLESARSIGLSSFQTMRFIVIPQVIKRILPALAGQFVSLIKDSSLLSIIAIHEFTLNAQQVNAFTYSTLESYFPLAIGYFIITFPISMFSRYLEGKTSYAS